MSKTPARPLVLTAFGASPDSAILLGAESEDAEGGIMFELRGKTAVKVGALQHRCANVARGFDDAHYGTSGKSIIVFRGSHAQRLRGPARAEDLGPIACFEGPGKTNTVLVAEADGAGLHRWDGRTWKPLALPADATLVSSISGRSLEDLFVCTGEGVVRIQKQRAAWLLSNEVDDDDPRCLDDEPYVAVPLDSERLLVVGSEGLHVWQKGRPLRRVRSPAEGDHCAAAARLGDAVYIASTRGVVRFSGARAILVNDYPCNGLEAVGEGLVACGWDGGARVWSGGSWSQVRFRS